MVTDGGDLKRLLGNDALHRYRRFEIRKAII